MSITLKKENFAISRLATGIGASDTSLTLISGQGALFPQSGAFRAVIWGANYDSPASDPNREVIEAALGSGDTFTITRASEGTTAGAWSASDNFALTITKGVLDEYEAEHSSHSARLTQAESDIAALESDVTTAQSGITQNATDIAALDTRVDAIEAFAGALVYRSTSQAISSATLTKITFNSEVFDTDAFHSTVLNTDRLTVPSAFNGKRVRITACVVFDANATGSRYCAVKLNGSTAIGLPSVAIAAAAGSNRSRMSLSSAPLAVSTGDYFELEVYQDSGGAPIAWVAYVSSTAPGTPITQTHSAQIANPGASDVEVKLIVQRSGAHIIERSFNVEAGSSAMLSMEQEGGQMWDSLSVVPVSGTLHVHSIAKTMRIDSAMFEPESEQAMAEPVMDTLRMGHTLGVSAKHAARIAYKESALGTPYAQRHSVTVKELDGASCRVRIAASTGERMEADVAPNSTETLTLEVPGGAWADATSIVALSGRFRVEDATKSVAYHSAGALATLATEATSTARRVVGDVVSVDARMCVDTDGSYAGAGTLIERPDHVARHFITHHMGMDASTIDLASFNAAGATYAAAISGGYRMGFLIDRTMKPSQILSSLAMQCRSTLHHSRGHWQMRYLPDAAPAPDATISQSELAGDGSHFIFSRTPVGELSNSITARYAWRDADNSYAGLASSQDAASIALYGRRALEVELWAVQDEAMAAHVLSHMLRERGSQRLTVELGVFFEYFGLEVGDTIEVAGGIYAGRRFFIEELRRVDKYTARIRGREWWA